MSTQLLKKFLTVKNIFLVLGVVVLIEVIWALTWLLKPSSSPEIKTPLQPSEAATITLSVPKTTFKVGEEIVVEVKLKSSAKTDGADLIIKSNPKLLEIKTSLDGPMAKGTIYQDFPQNTVDKNTGTITVSGITDLDKGVLANGVFGTAVYVAKAPGKTKIALDFKKGATTDSNIIETGTGLDILEKVEDLELNILP